MTSARKTADDIQLRGRGRPGRNDPTIAPDEELLRVGFDMFAQLGYDGTSLRVLGRSLGVSHNLISARFGSKAEFWKRAVAERIALRVPPIEAVFDDHFDTEEQRLKALILRYTELAHKDLGLASLVSLETRQDTWRLDYILDKYVRHFYEKLERLLLDVGIESGTKPIPPDPFIVIMVQGIGAYFAGLPLLRKLKGPAVDTDMSLGEHAALFAEILLPRVIGPSPKAARQRNSRKVVADTDG
jgi:TetR/AcrR family transcriptional regulator